MPSGRLTVSSVPMAPDPWLGPPEACSGGPACVHPPVQTNFDVGSPVRWYRVIPFEPTSTVPNEPTLAVSTVAPAEPPPEVEPGGEVAPPPEVVPPAEDVAPPPEPVSFDFPHADATSASATSAAPANRIADGARSLFIVLPPRNMV